MLTVTVPSEEFYDSEKEEFLYTEPVTFEMEHCLLAISKWESKWKKSFFSKESKTSEEVLDYIRCMTMSADIPKDVYDRLPDSVFSQIVDYIDDYHSATTIKQNGRPSREIITTEIIYYWMTIYNIPFECETWNIDRLLNLIQICIIKSEPPKKLGKNALRERNASLNAARRAQLHTKG